MFRQPGWFRDTTTYFDSTAINRSAATSSAWRASKTIVTIVSSTSRRSAVSLIARPYALTGRCGQAGGGAGASRGRRAGCRSNRHGDGLAGRGEVEQNGHRTGAVGVVAPAVSGIAGGRQPIRLVGGD